MQIVKKLQASIDFSTKILINSLASGAPPRELEQMYIYKFPRLPKFSRKIW